MIYFDNAATYVDNNQDVADYFLSINRKYIANANSTHHLGYLASKALINAKQEILKVLNLDNTYEVIFNSGATEGINHAIKGYCYHYQNRGREIICFKNEHPAVLETLKRLEKDGFIIHYVNPSIDGEVKYEEIKKLINNQTIMVIIMSVNNEIGSINNLSKVHEIIKGFPKCVLFSDVTQSVGKLSLNYSLIDMFAFSAHKFGGIIGSGALIKKKKIILDKLIEGGAQQDNLRSGTTPVALALSTTYALNKTIKNLSKNYEEVSKLHQVLINGLKKIDEVELNVESKFPYIQNFSLKTKKASVVIEALSNKEIYVSTKSACHSQNSEISYVLKNLGKIDKLCEDSIRVSFSSQNTTKEVQTFLIELNKILKEIR